MVFASFILLGMQADTESPAVPSVRWLRAKTQPAPVSSRRIMYVMQTLQFSLASFYDPVRSRQVLSQAAGHRVED